MQPRRRDRVEFRGVRKEREYFIVRPRQPKLGFKLVNPHIEFNATDTTLESDFS